MKNNKNINRQIAFQTIARMWLRQEFPELPINDPKFSMTVLFASYLDMTANMAEEREKNDKKIN